MTIKAEFFEALEAIAAERRGDASTEADKATEGLREPFSPSSLQDDFRAMLEEVAAEKRGQR